MNIEYKLIFSLVLVILGLLSRWLIIRHLNKLPIDEDATPKRWINYTKNVTNLIIAFGLIIIWITELRYVALSIAAFVVAFVIATREYIQCFVGSLYLASTRTFNIGDWISVGDHSGEVVRSDWLSTTLLEIDLDQGSYDYTGETLVIPNNKFALHTIKNLNYKRRFIAHTFSIIRDAEPVNPFLANEMILEKAKLYCQPFKEVAERYNSLIEKRLGVKIFGPEASVRIRTTNIGKSEFSITIFCPTHEAVALEQALTRDFFEFWHGKIAELEARKTRKDEDSVAASTNN